MARVSIAKLRKWHESQFDHFDALGRVASSSIKSLLADASIPYLSVTWRVKSAESFLKKAKNKRYSDAASECTDILGVRIITYIESDVIRASEVLGATFTIDHGNSMDKSALLEVDRIGYRSIHYVASLGPVRCALPEFARFKSTSFEIQIRTVLQHAWAEIEHDRNYKLPTSLPPNLERRLFLIAGVLELADREFNILASDIDEYSKSVSSRAIGGDLNIDINTPSLRVYCEKISAKFKHTVVAPSAEVSTTGEIVAELKNFGFRTLQDIDAIITPQFISEYDQEENHTTELGFLRDVMMFADIDRYFANAWKEKWKWTDREGIAFLATKYGKYAEELMRKQGINIGDIDDDVFEDETQGWG